MVAARGDDARGAALVILALFGVASCGTAIAAPFVEDGLAPLAGLALTLHALSALCLVVLPQWTGAPLETLDGPERERTEGLQRQEQRRSE